MQQQQQQKEIFLSLKKVLMYTWQRKNERKQPHQYIFLINLDQKRKIERDSFFISYSYGFSRTESNRSLYFWRKNKEKV